MRILHVITSLHTGGAEKLMLDLLPRLKEKGHDVDLLLLNGDDTPFREKIERAGIKVMQTRRGGSVYNPLNLIKIIPYLRKYDIVHTHNYASQLFAAIGSLIVHTNLCTTEHSTSNHRRNIKWFSRIDKWMYNRYNRIICISDIAEDSLKNYVGNVKAKILTINNGVDVDAFSSALPSDELRLFDSKCKSIIMVASMRDAKDQDTLIKGLSLLPNEFHLFLVGEGPRRNELEQLAKQCMVIDRVHFMGVRTDVPNLLRASDYVVMSSHWEGFGLAAAEGMAAGKPIIATDVDGLREVVKGAGILFPHEDAETLAREIQSLANDKAYYNSVANLCRARVNQFDIKKMADGYNNVYNELLNNI